MRAYDYERQYWVEGPTAVQLRIRQVKEDLNLLQSPKGQEYLAFLGRPHCGTQAIESLTKELAGLEGAL